MKKPKTDIPLGDSGGGKRNQKKPARYLYDSPLWNFRHEYAERQRCLWYIPSAKYGLLHPGKEVEAYDLTLSKLPVPEHRKWAKRILDGLREEVPTIWRKIIEIHAGMYYIEYGLEEGLRKAGRRVHSKIEETPKKFKVAKISNH
ncbi:MAG: hypothetical protein OXC39_09000 [Candidatus Dadabacteria bacterium]|nr:hypothetical protein [Candidatus Dadabacteria bacterium]